MPKITALLIIAFVVLTCSVVFILLHKSKSATVTQNQQNSQVITPQAVPPAEKVAELSFDTSQLRVPKGGYSTVYVMVNGKDKKITGVEVEAQYDPRIVSNVSVQSVDPSALGPKDTLVELYKAVNPVKGDISYIVGLQPVSLPQTAHGKVVAISFRVDPHTSAQNTMIKLLPTSMVMEEGINDSILKSSQPVNITILP